MRLMVLLFSATAGQEVNLADHLSPPVWDQAAVILHHIPDGAMETQAGV